MSGTYVLLTLSPPTPVPAVINFGTDVTAVGGVYAQVGGYFYSADSWALRRPIVVTTPTAGSYAPPKWTITFASGASTASLKVTLTNLLTRQSDGVFANGLITHPQSRNPPAGSTVTFACTTLTSSMGSSCGSLTIPNPIITPPRQQTPTFTISTPTTRYGEYKLVMTYGTGGPTADMYIDVRMKKCSIVAINSNVYDTTSDDCCTSGVTTGSYRYFYYPDPLLCVTTTDTITFAVVAPGSGNQAIRYLGDYAALDTKLSGALTAVQSMAYRQAAKGTVKMTITVPDNLNNYGGLFQMVPTTLVESNRILRFSPSGRVDTGGNPIYQVTASTTTPATSTIVFCVYPGVPPIGKQWLLYTAAMRDATRPNLGYDVLADSGVTANTDGAKMCTNAPAKNFIMVTALVST